MISEKSVLVLQGGGALGAYQAGVVETLSIKGYKPEWVAGVSIGAINGAIIAGNEPATCIEKLREFWDTVTFWHYESWLDLPMFRPLFEMVSASYAMVFGAPAFFAPRFPSPLMTVNGNKGPTSFYDTAPLRRTLGSLVDFDYLNDRGPRLSVGAVDVETGNFAYFDSHSIEITVDHVLASSALPPAFSPVVIDGKAYWDGGLVSNTPLQYVLESDIPEPLCIFQVDLFSASGAVPQNISDVYRREKDIRFSSRTRLTTDRFRQLHDIGETAKRLRNKLPKDLATDPDIEELCNVCMSAPVTLTHLIYHSQAYETEAKDYEFSRLSMRDHWRAGVEDANATLNNPSWLKRTVRPGVMQVFDLSHKKREKGIAIHASQ